LLSAVNRPCRRIARDDNCHFVSQQYDGRDARDRLFSGALHGCYKQMKSCRRESSDRAVGRAARLCSRPDVTSSIAVVRKLGRNWLGVALSLLVGLPQFRKEELLAAARPARAWPGGAAADAVAADVMAAAARSALCWDEPE